jgi:cell wall-associated NlpC family hydrolase/polyhydroxyalkanoate synthesis regulator phasin
VAKEIVMKQRKQVKHVSHEIHHYSNQVNMADVEIDSSEKEAVKKLVEEGKHTAEQARRIVKDISAAKKKRAATLHWHEGESYERKTHTFKKDHSNYSYGSRERATQRARSTTGVYRRAGSAQASQPARQATAARSMAVSTKAEVQTRKAAVAKAAAKSFKAAAYRGGKAIGKGFLSLGKWMLPVIVIAIPVIMVIGLIAGAVANMASPVGFFYSNDPDSAVTAQKIVSETQNEWNGKLRELREQHESQGYKVEVLYNDNEYDMGGKVNNWKDVLSLFIVTHANRNDETFLVLDDADKTGVHDLYFEMNPISVSTRTEQVEKEVQKEVERVVEHVSYVYNRSTQKLERIVTYETITETVTETVTEEVKYADISVRNLRYPEVMNKYAVTDVEKEWIDAFLSADAQEYWDMLGLDLGGSDMFIGDVDIIISNLPTGTLGSVIVQAAFTRLGDPYSMNLRGQGRYVDCSYLTQWAYAQAGVSIPGTAAEQARYCVENNKVIDPSAVQTGDLIFWSYPNNSRVSGRFMAIGHVAIYVSDGMMIEAAPSAGGVTYRAVSVQGTPAFYARPYV